MANQMASHSPTFPRLPKLTEIVVGGFKSFRDRTVLPIRPLTLLAGRNSAGKSSALQPLLLLKQTLDASFDAGPLRLDGDNVRFAKVGEMFWQGKKSVGKPGELEIGLTLGGEAEALFFRRRQRGQGVVLDRVRYGGLGQGDYELREGQDYDGMHMVRQRCELIGVPPGNDLPHSFARLLTVQPGPALAPFLPCWIHLPGLRGNPQRLYTSAQIGEVFPGTFPPYAASAIAAWQASGDARLDELGRWLFELELTWKVDTRSVGDTQVELRVGRLPGLRTGGARDVVNIADVGIGVSQTLPLLVALLLAERNQVVHVEQPEIHLHPTAQIALARLLLRAAERGVTVLAETHSHLLLRAVQALVASGEFSADLVQLHWFQRDDDGATEVISTGLDLDGSFGAWPEDLAEAHLQVEEAFLRAAFRAGGGKSWP